MTEKPTALIAMSGGVDSSVAAALMVQRGYDCIGVTMKLRSSSDCACTDKSCCTADDAEDARNAAYSMGMKFYVFNFVDEFERDVIGRFIIAYENGQTPNPCIDCNRYMKFELLYQRGRALGCEYIVTGHYARTEFLPEYGRWVLKKARNLAKDQSFVELRREGIRALAGPALREEPAAASLEKRLQIAALKYRVELHGFEPLLYVLKQLRRRLVA